MSLKDGEFLTAYGTPGGYLPLRDLLQRKLSIIGVVADTSQIILTTGVTHAMDLVIRYFVRPGDAVLVDDPGYFILFGGLKSFGAKIVGVPWNHDGPDTLAMETLIKEHPKLFFTNTILHNPTGASLSHTRWDCKYHVVLIPKRRKQAIFGALRHLGEIFRELAVQRKCTVVLFAAKFIGFHD